MIRLPPGSAHVLEFRYTANTFLDPEKVRFKYRLDGYDKDWRDGGDERKTIYTNLRPGPYRFQVVGGNKPNAWSQPGAALAFYLAPNFYQTWWFRFASAVSIAFAAVSVYRWRVNEFRRLEGLKHELALEREQARIARDIHDDFGASLTQIRLLTELAKRNFEPKDKMVDPLRQIAEVSAEMSQSSREIVWALQSGNNTLRSLLAYLRQYVANYLSLVGIRLEFECPESVIDASLSSETRHFIYMAVKEALHNIVQHSGAKAVTMSLTVEQSQFVMEIRDDGRGFEITAAQEAGNGLTNMEQRLTAVGGQFRLESRPGCGTKIVFTVPLGLSRES